MNRIHHALLWAAVIMIFALAVAFGLVEEEPARTMFIVLPVLAWATISARPCLQRRAGGLKGDS